MNPNEFGLYMIILPHEARFCTIFGKIFKENEKSQPLWLTLNDLYFALNMDFQRKKPIFAYKTSYFQFGTLKYIDVVSAAEQRLGNFRSNVGNYQSAFNGLNVSVSQIVRELPSATMGANMFFLAISNNIPMLVDEINKLRAANKLAMKEGKQGVPILKQLGAAVFSWNSLISVGITLLTVYGKDIVSWIGNLFKGREAAMTMAEAQAEVNKQMAESSGSYGDQVAQLRTLQLQWNQLGDDLKAKTEFVKNNREAFDKLGVAITTVADADNLFIQNTDAFIEAMNLRAQANAANELATQKYKDALIARQEAEDKIKRGTVEKVYAGPGLRGGANFTYRRMLAKLILLS